MILPGFDKIVLRKTSQWLKAQCSEQNGCITDRRPWIAYLRVLSHIDSILQQPCLKLAVFSWLAECENQQASLQLHCSPLNDFLGVVRACGLMADVDILNYPHLAEWRAEPYHLNQGEPTNAQHALQVRLADLCHMLSKPLLEHYLSGDSDIVLAEDIPELSIQEVYNNLKQAEAQPAIGPHPALAQPHLGDVMQGVDSCPLADDALLHDTWVSFMMPAHLMLKVNRTISRQ